jgi:hypothetical protein
MDLIEPWFKDLSSSSTNLIGPWSMLINFLSVSIRYMIDQDSSHNYLRDLNLRFKYIFVYILKDHDTTNNSWTKTPTS